MVILIATKDNIDLGVWEKMDYRDSITWLLY